MASDLGQTAVATEFSRSNPPGTTRNIWVSFKLPRLALYFLVTNRFSSHGWVLVGSLYSMGDQRPPHYNPGPPHHWTRPFRCLPDVLLCPRHRHHGSRWSSHTKLIQMGLLRILGCGDGGRRPLNRLRCRTPCSRKISPWSNVRGRVIWRG